MMLRLSSLFFFFFNDTATTEIYTLSLHDALPILLLQGLGHGLQYTVSAVMPPAVIDALEVVYVAYQHGDRGHVRIGQAQLGSLLEGAAVEQVGQRVVVALLAQRGEDIAHRARQIGRAS